MHLKLASVGCSTTLSQSFTHADLFKLPTSFCIQLIILLSYRLTNTESKYWYTELEITCLVWLIKRIRHLTELSSRFEKKGGELKNDPSQRNLRVMKLATRK